MIRIISPTISGFRFGGRGVLAIAFLYLTTLLTTTLLTTTTTTMFANAAPATTKTTARNIKILNHSGAKVELYWIHVSLMHVCFVCNCVCVLFVFPPSILRLRFIRSCYD